jgi:predicted membrane protein DUF2142
MNPGAPPASVTPPTRLQWLWLGAAFLFGLLFLVLIPPFQTNDEIAHWFKLNSLLEHQPACARLPARVLQLVDAAQYQDTRYNYHHFSMGSFDPMLAVIDPHPIDVGGWREACGYPSVAYVVPGLMALVADRLWPSRTGALVAAYYAARLGNWLTLTAGVLLVFLTVPLARSWTLLTYSVPMVVHQSVSINQDATIVALCCVLVVALFRLRGWAQLALIVATVALLTMIKPIYGPLMLWTLPALWELTFRGDRRAQRWRLALLLAGGALVTVAALWRLWPWMTLERRVYLGTPSWTNPGEQVWNIFHRPALLWTALQKQFKDNLGEGHLTGGWVSMLGVMGWCQYKLPRPAYHHLLWASGLALLADAARPGWPRLPPLRSWLQALICRALPALAPLAVVLLIDVAFWVTFTEAGKPYIVGVQGRYYHASLYLFGVGLSSWLSRRHWLEWLRRDLVHVAATAAALACVVSAWADTLGFLRTQYWIP